MIESLVVFTVCSFSRSVGVVYCFYVDKKLSEASVEFYRGFVYIVKVSFIFRYFRVFFFLKLKKEGRRNR